MGILPDTAGTLGSWSSAGGGSSRLSPGQDVWPSGLPIWLYHDGLDYYLNFLLLVMDVDFSHNLY